MFALSLGILEKFALLFFSSLLNKLSDTTVGEHQCYAPNIAQFGQCCIVAEVVDLFYLHSRKLEVPCCDEDAVWVCRKDD